MELKTDDAAKTLAKYMSPLSFFAMSLACCIGWGAFILPGTTFLPKAGPVGTLIALTIGAAIMIVIAANIHYMMNRQADSGGAFTYAKKIFGYDYAFLCTWFLFFTYVALLWFNVTTFVLIADKIFGNVFHVGISYNLAGHEVYLGEIIFAAVIILGVGIFSSRRKSLLNRAGMILATAFPILGLICAAATFTVNGGTFNFYPQFSAGSSTFSQILGAISTIPLAFAGFTAVSHATEEFKFSPKKSFWIMAAAIISACIFYAAMTCLSISVIPIGYSNWEEYVSHLSELDGLEALPAFYAANEVLGKFGLTFLTLSAVGAIFTSILVCYFASSRLMYIAAKDNVLPKRFAVLNADNLPANAVIFVTLISLITPFLGQATFNLFKDVMTFGVIVAYGYVSLGAYLMAMFEHDTKYMLFGAAGTFFAVVLGILFFVPSLSAENLFPRESYLIFILIGILGFIFFRAILERDTERRFGKSVVVCIALPFIILFGSLMWTRQDMAENFSVTLKNIGGYFSDELQKFGLKADITQKLREEYYLKTQIDEVSSAIFINNLLQTLLIIVTLLIMLSITSFVRRREREIGNAKLRAEVGSSTKAHFLAAMSTDISMPVSAINGYALLALRENMTPEEMREFLKKIETSSQYLIETINGVLELSDIDGGKVELHESPVDIVKLINDVNDMFAERAEKKSINLTVEFSNVQNPFVRCDQRLLNRVLINLTDNAVKFSHVGGKVEITLRQLESKSQHVGSYEFRVKDNGIGMSEEFAEKIFEPFEREINAAAMGAHGTGLGLAITKSIVDLMRGKISVYTKPNQGAEFIVNLFFAFESEPPQPAVTFEVDDIETPKNIIIEEVGEKPADAVHDAPHE
ncbi:MAG: amino acid permease [Selenomonadaceae bacterium]|nr:amino acid permease [Selenomonadaceae bacterium]